jgi:hypothetical protein
LATKVYEEEEFELQDGSTVKIRPLNIKKLREFMAVVKGLDAIDNEEDSVDILLKACAVAISQSNKALSENTELLEEALDVPTMYKILEVAGGVKMNDPNLIAAALGGTN